MLKSTWTERQTVEYDLAALIEAEDTLRLRLIDIQERRTKAQYALNRLRREAGEIK
jgi:hypothetical protein